MSSACALQGVLIVRACKYIYHLSSKDDDDPMLYLRFTISSWWPHCVFKQEVYRLQLIIIYFTNWYQTARFKCMNNSMTKVSEFFSDVRTEVPVRKTLRWRITGLTDCSKQFMEKVVVDMKWETLSDSLLSRCTYRWSQLVAVSQNVKTSQRTHPFLFLPPKLENMELIRKVTARQNVGAGGCLTSAE